MKIKELEDKFNGKILENGVRILYISFLNAQSTLQC